MTQKAGSPTLRYLGWGIFAVIVGIPMLLFLGGISYGVFLFPVMALLFLGVGFVLMAPWFLAHLALSLVTSPMGVAEALENNKPLRRRVRAPRP
jgi:hypothetical protein